VEEEHRGHEEQHEHRQHPEELVHDLARDVAVEAEGRGLRAQQRPVLALEHELVGGADDGAERDHRREHAGQRDDGRAQPRALDRAVAVEEEEDEQPACPQQVEGEVVGCAQRELELGPAALHADLDRVGSGVHRAAPSVGSRSPTASSAASWRCTSAMYVSSRLERVTSRSVISSPYCAKSPRTNAVASWSACTKLSPPRVQRTSEDPAASRASWAGLPSATMRPRERMRIRSASFSASARSWVVSRIDVSSRSTRPCTLSWKSRRASGAKPAVGSERKSTSGRPTIPIATSSRRRSPPESLAMRRSARPSRPTVPSSSSVSRGRRRSGVE